MINFSPMTGFEPQTSGVGSDCSTNRATTTALGIQNFSSEKEKACSWFTALFMWMVDGYQITLNVSPNA